MTERSGVAVDAVTERETSEEEAQGRRALFRVVRGEPSDVEIAALTVVLAAAAAASQAPPAATAAPDRWSDPEARFRRPLHPGPGVWRTSTWPR